MASLLYTFTSPPILGKSIELSADLKEKYPILTDNIAVEGNSAGIISTIPNIDEDVVRIRPSSAVTHDPYCKNISSYSGEEMFMTLQPNYYVPLVQVNFSINSTDLLTADTDTLKINAPDTDEFKENIMINGSADKIPLDAPAVVARKLGVSPLFEYGSLHDPLNRREPIIRYAVKPDGSQFKLVSQVPSRLVVTIISATTTVVYPRSKKIFVDNNTDERKNYLKLKFEKGAIAGAKKGDTVLIPSLSAHYPYTTQLFSVESDSANDYAVLNKTTRSLDISQASDMNGFEMYIYVWTDKTTIKKDIIASNHYTFFFRAVDKRPEEVILNACPSFMAPHFFGTITNGSVKYDVDYTMQESTEQKNVIATTANHEVSAKLEVFFNNAERKHLLVENSLFSAEETFSNKILFTSASDEQTISFANDTYSYYKSYAGMPAYTTETSSYFLYYGPVNSTRFNTDNPEIAYALTYYQKHYSNGVLPKSTPIKQAQFSLLAKRVEEGVVFYDASGKTVTSSSQDVKTRADVSVVMTQNNFDPLFSEKTQDGVGGAVNVLLSAFASPLYVVDGVSPPRKITEITFADGKMTVKFEAGLTNLSTVKLKFEKLISDATIDFSSHLMSGRDVQRKQERELSNILSKFYYNYTNNKWEISHSAWIVGRTELDIGQAFTDDSQLVHYCYMYDRVAVSKTPPRNASWHQYVAPNTWHRGRVVTLQHLSPNSHAIVPSESAQPASGYPHAVVHDTLSPQMTLFFKPLGQDNASVLGRIKTISHILKFKVTAEVGVGTTEAIADFDDYHRSVLTDCRVYHVSAWKYFDDLDITFSFIKDTNKIIFSSATTKVIPANTDLGFYSKQIKIELENDYADITGTDIENVAKNPSYVATDIFPRAKLTAAGSRRYMTKLTANGKFITAKVLHTYQDSHPLPTNFADVKTDWDHADAVNVPNISFEKGIFFCYTPAKRDPEIDRTKRGFITLSCDALVQDTHNEASAGLPGGTWETDSVDTMTTRDMIDTYRKHYLKARTPSPGTPFGYGTKTSAARMLATWFLESPHVDSHSPSWHSDFGTVNNIILTHVNDYALDSVSESGLTLRDYLALNQYDCKRSVFQRRP